MMMMSNTHSVLCPLWRDCCRALLPRLYPFSLDDVLLTAAALFWLATLIRAYSTEIAEAKPSPLSTLRVTAMRVCKTKDFNNKIREELREKRA